MSKKIRTTLNDMIVCPYCHAYSYPRLYSDPKTEEEKVAIICGSCRVDLRPYLKAMEEYQKKMREKAEMKPTVDSALIVGEGNDTEVYIDSEKVAEEVLTNIDTNSKIETKGNENG